MASRKSASKMKMRRDLLDIIMQPSKSWGTSSGHRKAREPLISKWAFDARVIPISHIYWRESDHPETRKGFLNLPYEIRDMIYRLALVSYPDITFIDSAELDALYSTRQSSAGKKSDIDLSIPYYNYEVLHRPRLFAVSKFVSEEAMAVFYGKNTFCLPARMGMGASRWKTHAHLFRKVVVRLSWYDLVCGSPRSNASNKYDENAERTDNSVALNLQRAHKRPGFDKVVAAAVGKWRMNREMFALLVNVESVQIKIEGGVNVWIDPRPFLMIVDDPRMSLRIVPFLKDWSEFMFGETSSCLPSTTLSRRRPAVDAHIEYNIGSDTKMTVNIGLKGNEVAECKTSKAPL